MPIISALSLLLLAQDALEPGVRAFSEGKYAEAARLLEAAPESPTRDLFRQLATLGQRGCGGADLTALDRQWRTLNDARLKRLAGIALAQCVPSALQELQAAYPNDADVLYQVARHHLRAWNDAVFAMYQRAPSSYRVHQLSAEILEIQGKLPEAEAEFRKAIAKAPQALNLHFRLGRVLLLQAQGAAGLASARAEFEKELERNPSDAAAEFQVGQILQAEGKPAEARPRLERALALSPGLAEAALALAKIESQDKQYGKAIALLEGVTTRQPNHEAALYNLMLAYRNAGRMDKARAAKAALDKLQKPPEGEFTEFLKKLEGKK